MSEKGATRHKHRQHENGLQRFWRKYRVELLCLLVVALGLFLLLEQMSLREILAKWFVAVTARVVSGFHELDTRLPGLIESISLSHVAGAVLMVGAVAAILLRIRSRLLADPTLTALRCPTCGGSIHRIHRTTLDHMLCVYVPVRRYRCTNLECGWHGLRVGASHSPSGHRHVPSS